MPNIHGSANLHRIVVLNSKGGSGKTTLAFNIAGYLTSTGRRVALIDMDPQGSSARWLSNRRSELPEIHGVRLPADHSGACPPDVVKLPPDVEYVVIDSPAGVTTDHLDEYTRGAHAILLPIMPSDIDIHAATRLIQELLLEARVSRANKRLGIVANRVKERTVSYRQLQRFLSRLSIAVVGTIRDSQNYVAAARDGLCIHEMPQNLVSKDLKQWASVTTWLEERLASPLTERDWRAPDEDVSVDITAELPALVQQSRSWWQRWVNMPIATAFATVAIGALSWAVVRSPDPEPVMPATAGVVERAPLSSVDAVSDFALPAETNVEQVASADASNLDGDLSPADALRHRWALSGVVRSGSENIVILTDRIDQSTLQVTPDSNVDGWLVTEAGRNYAVLAQNGEQVRLEFNAAPEEQNP